MCYIPGDAWDFKVDASYSRIDPTELEIPHEIIHSSFLIRSELIHKNPSITQKSLSESQLFCNPGRIDPAKTRTLKPFKNPMKSYFFSVLF